MLSSPALARIDRWLPAAVAALCWALAAGGAVLWWWHTTPGRDLPAVSPLSQAAPRAQANNAGVLRALGHTAAASEPVGDAPRRFQLLGVVAGASGQGAALLAVDGQPPQAFVQGQAVTDGWRVHSLSAEGVRLQAEGVAPLLLSLPAR